MVPEAVVGIVVDEQVTLTLEELSGVVRLQPSSVVQLVEEGVLEPAGGETPDEWLFRAGSLGRLQAGLRLQSDLGLNAAGAALALDLLDELRALRARNAVLEALLEDG